MLIRFIRPKNGDVLGFGPFNLISVPGICLGGRFARSLSICALRAARFSSVPLRGSFRSIIMAVLSLQSESMSLEIYERTSDAGSSPFLLVAR